MTTTAPTTTFAIYYRPSGRRRKNRTWTLHNTFPTRAEADQAASEIGCRFRHLDLWVTPIEPTATADTDPTPERHRAFKLRHQLARAST